MTDTVVSVYAQAAESYWQAGWRSVLPLPPARKIFPPTGYTGYAAIEPSYPDLLQWIEAKPHANLCLRLPDGIIGIDVDGYGEKTGADTIVEAEKRWGPLPPAPRSTSREDDPVSGITLYTVPPGTRLHTTIGFPDQGIGDIEVIQPHHRYVVCWPSVHPEGRLYRWYDEDGRLGEIPRPETLHPLPPAWLTAMCEPLTASFDFGSVDINNCLTPGTASEKVSARLAQAVADLAAGSRHDAILEHSLALLRYGRQGHPGVANALKALREIFVHAVSRDGSRTPDEARSEFSRFITNKGAARLIAAPGITDWASFVPDPSAATEHNGHRPLSDADREFWEARDSLGSIYTTALSRMCSPWAVLAHCAARALTLVRPCVVLPPLIGGPGSLNWFGAVVARSGGGKGSAVAAARELIPAHVEHRNLGSGEGIVAAYDPDAEQRPGHEALMFTADEADTLSALSARSGSTTLAILRSGFSGEALGFSYSDRSKCRLIAPQSYRMTLALSVQPERAGALLGDLAGGTPQRFMWFPGTDARILRERPWPAGPLMLPPVTIWRYPRELTIPTEAEDLILNERAKAMRDEVDALDGHALFCREKFAFALCVLDGRFEMTSEDWQLSEVAAKVSAGIRRWVAELVTESDRREAAEVGQLRGITMEAAEHEKTLLRDDRLNRILRWALSKLVPAGADGIGNRELALRIAGRDRPLLATVLAAALTDGLITRHPENGNWVAL